MKNCCTHPWPIAGLPCQWLAKPHQGKRTRMSQGSSGMENSRMLMFLKLVYIAGHEVSTEVQQSPMKPRNSLSQGTKLLPPQIYKFGLLYCHWWPSGRGSLDSHSPARHKCVKHQEYESPYRTQSRANKEPQTHIEKRVSASQLQARHCSSAGSSDLWLQY